MDRADWQARAEAVTDSELAEFRRCERCANELGVCPFDQLMTGWGSVRAQDAEAIAAGWLALLMRGYSAERAAAKRALKSFPLPGIAAAARELEGRVGLPTRSPARAEFIVGFDDHLPDGVEEGAAFLNGTVVRVNTALSFAVVETGDAARFEALVAEDPRVRYIELDVPGR